MTIFHLFFFLNVINLNTKSAKGWNRVRVEMTSLKYDCFTNYCSVIHQDNLHSLQSYMNFRLSFSISAPIGGHIEHTESGNSIWAEMPSSR